MPQTGAEMTKQAYLLFTLDKLIAAFIKQVRGVLHTLQKWG